MINKVFCIDDDDITIMLHKMVIKKCQFAAETITAINGRDALEYYDKLLSKSEPLSAKDYPSLIFLDINMPVLNGWEFLDEFMKNYYPHFPLTKVIIVSSTVNPEDFLKAKEYSIIFDFLSKPLSIVQLEKLKDTFVGSEF